MQKDALESPNAENPETPAQSVDVWLPQAADAAGISFDELIKRILDTNRP